MMSSLPSEEKVRFKDFMKWRKDAVSFMSYDISNLTYLILFGEFNREEHRTRNICGTYDKCRDCPMFSHSRCHSFVKKEYAEYPTHMRDIMKTDYARADFLFYEQIKGSIEANMTELCMIVGSYRIEIFLEDIYTKAIDSIVLHNKINSNNKYSLLENKTPKYYSADYIRDNDIWFMFKETQAEGDIICSLLSDF